MGRKKERVLSRSNYQVKRRRRREGKTDYKHRTNLLRQDGDKHGAVKSRLVVRKTNSKIIVSIHQAFMGGDRVVAHADSSELERYGISFGHTNYFAAYATGMLCARRALEQMGGEMDKIYEPKREVGIYDLREDKEGERRAYKVFLDIGLARASRGARVFAAMKGASDGGLHIPHSESKFYGFTESDGLDSTKLRERIFSKPTIDYMIHLRDNDSEKYEKQFSGYISAGIRPEDIETRQRDCLEAIIKNPKKIPNSIPPRAEHYMAKIKKLTTAERRANAKAKIAAALNQ